MVDVAVTGATGRMGRAVIEGVDDRSDLSLSFAVNRDPDVDAVDGHRVHPSADLRRLIADREPDVLVDFTGPYSAVRYAETCAQTGVAFVSGTTGIDNGHLERLRGAADSVPVLHTANFARGIGVLESALREAVESLPEYDVEVVETHHGEKVDAPSGTTGRLLDAVDEAAGRDHDRVHGREGEGARAAGEVGVHSVRAGSVAGEHAVVVAGKGEYLRLEHRAGDRRAYVRGALAAASFVAGRSSGWYDLDAVHGDG